MEDDHSSEIHSGEVGVGVEDVSTVQDPSGSAKSTQPVRRVLSMAEAAAQYKASQQRKAEAQVVNPSAAPNMAAAPEDTVMQDVDHQLQQVLLLLDFLSGNCSPYLNSNRQRPHLLP
jgi:hypothetical protein